jgi:hypothetical protein
MRQARIASIAGESAQPAASAKLRGLPRAGFAATNNTHALRTVKYRYAPKAFIASMRFNILQIRPLSAR